MSITAQEDIQLSRPDQKNDAGSRHSGYESEEKHKINDTVYSYDDPLEHGYFKLIDVTVTERTKLGNLYRSGLIANDQRERSNLTLTCVIANDRRECGNLIPSSVIANDRRECGNLIQKIEDLD